jgi:hypothetical protein
MQRNPAAVLDRKFGALYEYFLKRKYSDPSRGTGRVHDNLPVRLGLYQFGGWLYSNDNGC